MRKVRIGTGGRGAVLGGRLRCAAMGFAAMGLAATGGAATGCSAAPPPDAPPAPPAPAPDLDDDLGDLGPAEPEPIETGKDCATAEAVCDLGVCTAKLVNGCAQPVTCAFEILAMCQGTDDGGEARGKSRGTVPAGAEGEIQAAADCEDKAVASTLVDRLSCS
ncbi:MAG: hypothetical protein AAF928_14945 [Myxococcota bacterium]